MYSIVLNGKVFDYRYIKITDICYAFYVGDIYVGQIFKADNWSCVGKYPHVLCPMHGFKTRLHASEFLLKIDKRM